MIGSLCSGYGGLDLALEAVTGLETGWLCEYDKHASVILDQRFPGVPNFGDITTTDWAQVEPVEWITAGYPCQPFSHAGKQKGTADVRHIWPHVADAIRILRPRNVLLENVAGHLSLGFGDVLADLAALRYDARWGVVRAADVGAPHSRKRVFIVATDSASVGLEGTKSLRFGEPVGERTGDGGRTAPDASGERHGGWQDGRTVGRVDSEDEGPSRKRKRTRAVTIDRSGEAVADASRDGRHEGWSESARLERRPDASLGGATTTDTDSASSEARQPRATIGESATRRVQPVGEGDTAWGNYAAAIHRWGRIIGRTAPAPTEPGRNGPRLSPLFVEWMMGLPAGWVTDTGIPRNAQLKALGNGVVPQQAAAAVRWLVDERVAA